MPRLAWFLVVLLLGCSQVVGVALFGGQNDNNDILVPASSISHEGDEFTTAKKRTHVQDLSDGVSGSEDGISELAQQDGRDWPHQNAPQGEAWGPIPAAIVDRLRGVRLTVLELAAATVAILYIAVYVLGSRANQAIVQAWAREFDGLFRQQFALAGPASSPQEWTEGQVLLAETASQYVYYATGRRGCHSLVATLDLQSRHDLFFYLYEWVNPKPDTLTLEVTMTEDMMDPMVFAICRKKGSKAFKASHRDLREYAGTVSAASLPNSLSCLSESAELAESLLPPLVAKVLGTHEKLITSIHFTDQNTKTITGQQEVPPNVLRFHLALPHAPEADAYKGLRALVEVALQYVDHVSQYRMPATMKTRAKERRQAVAERKAKSSHAQRQEIIQQRKAEKLRKEKLEYEALSTEQKRKRDQKDEKRAKKAMAKPKIKVKMK